MLFDATFLCDFMLIKSCTLQSGMEGGGNKQGRLEKSPKHNNGGIAIKGEGVGKISLKHSSLHTCQRKNIVSIILP